MRKYSLYTLVLVLFGVIIIITSLYVYLSVTIQKERLIVEETKTKIHLAETINEILYSPLWIYRLGMFPGLGKAFIEEVAKFENVVYVRVVLIDGTIRQSTIEGEWGKKIEDPGLLALLPTETIITREEIFQKEKIKSIVYPGYGNHVILVGFSLKGVEKVAEEMIIYNILLNFGNLALIILVIFLVLKNNILNPLGKMAVACREVGKGNLSIKVNVKSSTEIEELATTFNEMIKDLEKSHIALEEGKAVLEIKVKARTKELSELAESLDEQVKERTKGLQEKLEELEKFHQLTVGRELKIVVLKDEIKKLKKELEKYKLST